MPVVTDRPLKATLSRVQGCGPRATMRSGSAASEIATLRALWGCQQQHAAARGLSDAGMEYLAAHFAMDLTLWRHLRVIDATIPYIRGKVLEWGCRHALVYSAGSSSVRDFW